MTTLQEFRCEICGRVTNSPNHWFVIQCSDVELSVLKWNAKAANAPEPAISAAKHMPRSIPADGWRRYVLRPSPTS